MNAQQLFLADGSPSDVWFCSVCRTTAVAGANKELAERCCTCSYCGQKTEKFKLHNECFQKQSAEQDAERIAKAEKLEEWDGFVYLQDFHDDGFFETLSALIEAAQDDGCGLPEFVFVCEPQPFPCADVSDVIERVTQEMYEDAEADLNGVKELSAAIDAFNEANKAMVSYYPDYKRVVRVPPIPVPVEEQEGE